MKRNKKLIEKFNLYKLFYDDYEYKDKSSIKHIDMVSTNKNICNIYSDGYSVYANTKFYPNDIIEICPTREIDRTSLYSRDMRNIVFEVIPNEQYVIPFGYCQYYDILSGDNNYANCDYLWDSIAKTIVIKAITKINKGEKLILNIRK